MSFCLQKGMLGRIREQISEYPKRICGFLPAQEFSKTMPWFSPGYKSTDNISYFFFKMIRLDKEKDNIRSKYVYFYFFRKTFNSHNFETTNHIAHVIFVFYSATKTHLLTNQNAHTTQINILIIIY